MPKFLINPCIHVYCRTEEVEAETAEKAEEKANRKWEEVFDRLDRDMEVFGEMAEIQVDSVMERNSPII